MNSSLFAVIETQVHVDTEIKFARDIKAGELELICPEMELLACPSYEDVALKGTGVIRSDNLGKLYFRMIASFKGARHKSLFGLKSPGEAYDPEDYVMLRAVDESGMEWRSNWLIINLRNEIPLPNYSIRKTLFTILNSQVLHQQGTTPSDHGWVQIVVPNGPMPPFDMVTEAHRSVRGREIGKSLSVDHHSHRIGEAQTTFRREDDNFLSISAGMEHAFAPTWPGLLCHALGFASGETILPSVVTRGFNDHEHIELRSGPYLRYSSIMPQPIYSRGSEGAADFWRLVELFLIHVEQKMPESDQRLLLDELQGIRRGAQGSFQTACLTLGVGMESITKLLLSDEPTESASEGAVRDLLDYLNRWQGDVAIRERARGAVSGLADKRAVDILHACAKRTGATPKLVDAWKKLRNHKAHGNEIDDTEGRSLYYAVVELLHRVVATKIGYDGPITRTSEPGWGTLWNSERRS